MKMKTFLTLAAALGALSLTAHAQDGGGPPPDGGGQGGPGGQGGHGPGMHGHRPPLPIITVLDVNRDGIIDSNEIANASAQLKTLDKNGDGQLTSDEYLPTRPADAPKDAPHPPTPAIVKALDANGDGVIDASEIANASAALLKLDKNGDGQLTRDEYIGKRPGRPPMDGNGGPDGHGGPGGGPGGPGGPDGGGAGNDGPQGPPPGN